MIDFGLQKTLKIYSWYDGIENQEASRENAVAQILECYSRNFSPHFLPQSTLRMPYQFICPRAREEYKIVKRTEMQFFLNTIRKDFEISSLFDLM